MGRAAKNLIYEKLGKPKYVAKPKGKNAKKAKKK